MTREEIIEATQKVQKKFYSGRKVWWKDGCKDLMIVQYAFVYRDGIPKVVTFENPGCIADAVLFQTFPPFMLGTYLVLESDPEGSFSLFRYDGRCWWEIESDGEQSGKRQSKMPVGQLLKIGDKIDGPVFPEEQP